MSDAPDEATRRWGKLGVQFVSHFSDGPHDRSNPTIRTIPADQLLQTDQAEVHWRNPRPNVANRTRPIDLYETSEGGLHVGDGHHRLVRARREGQDVRARVFSLKPKS